MENFLLSIEKEDKNTDEFRYPFSSTFLERNANVHLDISAIVNRLENAHMIIDKCLANDCNHENELDSSLSTSFFSITDEELGNCFIWKSHNETGTFTDYDYYIKIRGFIDTADLLIKNNNLSCNTKIYPILFLCRHSIELCMKRILFYSIKSDNQIVDKLKKPSHSLLKIWNKVNNCFDILRETLPNCKNGLDEIYKRIIELHNIDKNGDSFRYPTNLDLDYRFNNKTLDFNIIYMFMISTFGFFDACFHAINEGL